MSGPSENHVTKLFKMLETRHYDLTAWAFLSYHRRAPLISTIWKKYLKSIGCGIVPRSPQPPRKDKFVRVPNPRNSSEEIVVGKNLALKALALGEFPKFKFHEHKTKT
jgi:hypothetical protein